jgi:hypothetical protein
MYSTLSLKWRTRQGGGGHTHWEYLDFLVDGRSLWEHLGAADVIGCLGWGNPAEEQRAAERLLLRAPSTLSLGRVPLFICAECGDLDCGAVTAQVERTPEGIAWYDFAFEDSGGEITRYPKYQALGPFLFNKAEYWRALNDRLGIPAP